MGNGEENFGCREEKKENIYKKSDFQTSRVILFSSFFITTKLSVMCN